MKCVSCGKEISEDANYCGYCGARQEVGWFHTFCMILLILIWPVNTLVRLARMIVSSYQTLGYAHPVYLYQGYVFLACSFVGLLILIVLMKKGKISAQQVELSDVVIWCLWYLMDEIASAHTEVLFPSMVGQTTLYAMEIGSTAEYFIGLTPLFHWLCVIIFLTARTGKTGDLKKKKYFLGFLLIAWSVAMCFLRSRIIGFLISDAQLAQLAEEYTFMRFLLLCVPRGILLLFAGFFGRENLNSFQAGMWVTLLCIFRICAAYLALSLTGGDAYYLSYAELAAYGISWLVCLMSVTFPEDEYVSEEETEEMQEDCTGKE